MKLEQGVKIGYWVLIKETDQRKSGNILWECQCICGAIRLVRGTALRTNRSNHCGCKTGELNGNRYRRHGASRGPDRSLYLIWQGIKNRCFNKNSFAYKDYGGRGIIMCPTWVNDFIKFKEDMIEGYSKGLTIERINVDGNYEKSNCCWVTRADQANNRRTTIYMDTDQGVMKIKDAAKIAGICWQAMYVRYKSWPKERWLEKYEK